MDNFMEFIPVLEQDNLLASSFLCVQDLDKPSSFKALHLLQVILRDSPSSPNGTIYSTAYSYSALHKYKTYNKLSRNMAPHHIGNYLPQNYPQAHSFEGHRRAEQIQVLIPIGFSSYQQLAPPLQGMDQVQAHRFYTDAPESSDLRISHLTQI